MSVSESRNGSLLLYVQRGSLTFQTILGWDPPESLSFLSQNPSYGDIPPFYQHVKMAYGVEIV